MTTPWRHSRTRKFVRDFHRQRYGNPLFPNAGSRVVRRGGPRALRRPSAGVPKRAVFLAALGIAAVGALWYLFWSPALRIASFDIQGASGPTEETVRTALEAYAGGQALLLFPKRNMLVFGEEAAKQAVDQAVFLDGVDIRKKLPGTIVVTVREKTMKAVCEHEGRLYSLDGSGFVVRELSGGEIALMGDLPPGLNAVQVQGLGAESMDVPPVKEKPPAQPPEKNAPAAKPADDAPEAPKNAWPLILDRRPDDQRKSAWRPGSQAFSAATVGLVLQASGRLPDIAGEEVRWFVPDETSDSVDATMAGDWHVFLATATPFDVQAERLSIVLKDKIGSRRPSLEYVDLRYNERIFFRLKDATQ
ncbi:MAG TPA: hypothetical protein VLC10_02085 [Patescibacteria group bacterium]|nr:hypothetical protein [Patescibacteria group bacterium]